MKKTNQIHRAGEIMKQPNFYILWGFLFGLFFLGGGAVGFSQDENSKYTIGIVYNDKLCSSENDTQNRDDCGKSLAFAKEIAASLKKKLGEMGSQALIIDEERPLNERQNFRTGRLYYEHTDIYEIAYAPETCNSQELGTIPACRDKNFIFFIVINDKPPFDVIIEMKKAPEEKGTITLWHTWGEETKTFAGKPRPLSNNEDVEETVEKLIKSFQKENFEILKAKQIFYSCLRFDFGNDLDPNSTPLEILLKNAFSNVDSRLGKEEFQNLALQEEVDLQKYVIMGPANKDEYTTFCEIERGGVPVNKQLVKTYNKLSAGAHYRIDGVIIASDTLDKQVLITLKPVAVKQKVTNSTITRTVKIPLDQDIFSQSANELIIPKILSEIYNCLSKEDYWFLNDEEQNSGDIIFCRLGEDEESP